MTYQILDDGGEPMDAHYDAEQGSLVLHSRGGTKSSPNARNTQYAEALRLLLTRIHASDLAISEVHVDSSRVQNLPREERRILSPGEASRDPGELFTMLSSRMAVVGRDPNARSGHGNSNKRIRFDFRGLPSVDQINGAVHGMRVRRDLRSRDRLPADQLNRVKPEHILRSVQKLCMGHPNDKFGPSTDYDVLADSGARLPPKAVFGLAASEVLGFEVQPRHFSGGEGTPCFKAIRQAGFEIVPKGEPSRSDDLPLDPEDRIWAEGRPRLATHLRKERARGLARAKKARFFEEQGRLFCERCGLDPEAMYGPELGDACIEVHHHAVQISDMDEDHETTLDDLQCLCANCHRVVHRLLREAN